MYFRENFVPLQSVMRHGFDNDKYLKIQSEHIKERIAQFGNKLYLELGGKLFDDHHASRVLPGFEPDIKLRMLSQLRDHAEIVIVISALDIEKNKVRNDLGITYDMDVLRLREEFQKRGFLVSAVVITHYNGQMSADAYRNRLERMGITAYYHYTIEGYPTNVGLIASDEGFGHNDYIETTRPLVIVTAPGPGSGKMAVAETYMKEAVFSGMGGYFCRDEIPDLCRALNGVVNEAGVRHQLSVALFQEPDMGKVEGLVQIIRERVQRIVLEYQGHIQGGRQMRSIF